VSRIRVLILDESRLHVDGLTHVLASEPSIVIAGGGATARVRELLRGMTTDILLVDARSEGALGLCIELRTDNRRPWTIVLGGNGDDEWAVRTLEAGARGILGQQAGPDELRKAILAVHDGQIWARKRIISKIVGRLATLLASAHAERSLMTERLSRREQEIAGFVASGLNNREIARRGAISEGTVKAHLTRIFQKLRIRDRTQLAAFYERAVIPRPAGESAHLEKPLGV
jgi:DNA-binding NarL/FixJ family response regulator